VAGQRWLPGPPATGSHFDPAVVAARPALPEILRIRELYRDDIIVPINRCFCRKFISRQPMGVLDESYNIGIDVIDAHHHLFDLTNDLLRSFRKNMADVRSCAYWGRSDQYASNSAEERMMAHWGYTARIAAVQMPNLKSPACLYEACTSIL
jgi:hypothetical protein